MATAFEIPVIPLHSVSSLQSTLLNFQKQIIQTQRTTSPPKIDPLRTLLPFCSVNGLIPEHARNILGDICHSMPELAQAASTKDGQEGLGKWFADNPDLMGVMVGFWEQEFVLDWRKFEVALKIRYGTASYCYGGVIVVWGNGALQAIYDNMEHQISKTQQRNLKELVRLPFPRIYLSPILGTCWWRKLNLNLGDLLPQSHLIRSIPWKYDVNVYRLWRFRSFKQTQNSATPNANHKYVKWIGVQM